MAINLTSPPGDIRLDGSARGGTALVEATGVEVWITDSASQERLHRIPLDALQVGGCVYREALGTDGLPDTSADVVVDRSILLDPDDPGSWLTHELLRFEREIQIVHDGRVTHWGPIMSSDREGGGASRRVRVAGAEWWFGGRLVTGEESVFGVEQLRSAPRVFDPPAEIGASLREWKLGVWFRRSDWRITAEVWVSSEVPADHHVLVVEVTGGSDMPPLRTVISAGQLSRGIWTTAVLHISPETRGTGSAGRTMTIAVAGAGGGPMPGPGEDPEDLLLREVSAQVSPTSVGLDEMDDPQARFYTHRESWLEIVGYLSDLGFVGWAEVEGTPGQVGWKRPDVFAVEAARQITEAGGGEAQIVAQPGLRAAQLRPRIGTQHDPETLTLDDATVIKWGGWQSGTGTPATEWIVANDEGFTGRYRDETALGGVRIQSYTAAPTGSPASSLAYRARSAADRAVEQFTERIGAVVAMDLVSTVMLGDRVWVDMDDGDDQHHGWCRVVAREVDVAAAGFGVTLSPWVVE